MMAYQPWALHCGSAGDNTSCLWILDEDDWHTHGAHGVDFQAANGFVFTVIDPESIFHTMTFREDLDNVLLSPELQRMYDHPEPMPFQAHEIYLQEVRVLVTLMFRHAGIGGERHCVNEVLDLIDDGPDIGDPEFW